MLCIKETIIVEGKYDKKRLAGMISANIIAVNGFAAFKDKPLLAMLRMLAEKDGLLILTDSDRAGFLIRNFIKSSIPKDRIRHAFIPNIPGTEKRKEKASKEGYLGVEGVSDDVIIEALRRAGCDINSEKRPPEITKLHLFEDGFSGTGHSRENRERLCGFLALPPRISANALLDVLNTLFTLKEYKETVAKVYAKPKEE